MRIENLRLEPNGNRARAVAIVTWEDCDRSSQELFFETDAEFAESLTVNPHAFLVACLLPAMRHKEKRISLDAAICPQLLDGLQTVMAWIRQWYGSTQSFVRIEFKGVSNGSSRRVPERAGFFFSGGVDSLALLRSNRLNFPSEHAGYFRDGLLIYGLEMDQPAAFEMAVNALSEIAREADITLLPIYTNIRYLDDDWVFYRDVFQGAILCSVAHALSRRLTSVSIASTADIPNLIPWGSHPLLDPNYSSSDLRISHEGLALSRYSKTSLVAGWNVALHNLRVCNKTESYRPEVLNCGKCEKCVRTILALLALGILKETRAFPKHDLSEETVSKVWINDLYEESCYRELVTPLLHRKRQDLARGIERAITSYRSRVRGEANWKASLSRLDRKYLNGSLSKVKRVLTSHSSN